jgi:transcription termination/antitermination protein NusG
MDHSSEKDASDPRWFAVWTRSRQEKIAAAMLGTLGVQHFLPLKSELRQWSDRKQTVHLPLFSGYLFVRMDPNKDGRLQVLKTPGIAGFVGNNTGPLPIPDQQIEDIRTVLTERVECTVLPFLEEGACVRVVRGPLAGVEGRLLQGNSTTRLLISIEMIHKSLAVSVSRQDVELLDSNATQRNDLQPTSGTPNRIYPPASLLAEQGMSKLEVLR